MPPGGDASRLVSWTRPDVRRACSRSSSPAVWRRCASATPAASRLRCSTRSRRSRRTGARCWRAAPRARRRSCTTTSGSTTSSSPTTASRSSSTGSWPDAAAARRTSPTCCRAAWRADALRECWDALVAPLPRAPGRRRVSATTTSSECRFHYRQSLLYTVAPGIAMLGQMALAAATRAGSPTRSCCAPSRTPAELDAFATL